MRRLPFLVLVFYILQLYRPIFPCFKTENGSTNLWVSPEKQRSSEKENMQHLISWPIWDTLHWFSVGWFNHVEYIPFHSQKIQLYCAPVGFPSYISYISVMVKSFHRWLKSQQLEVIIGRIPPWQDHSWKIDSINLDCYGRSASRPHHFEAGSRSFPRRQHFSWGSSAISPVYFFIRIHVFFHILNMTPKSSILYSRIFHYYIFIVYKPSILGYHYLWKAILEKKKGPKVLLKGDHPLTSGEPVKKPCVSKVDSDKKPRLSKRKKTVKWQNRGTFGKQT